METNDPIARLARQIEATKKAEHLRVDAGAIHEVRRKGAGEVHRICAEFVAAVNGRLSSTQLELSPADYGSDSFRPTGANVIQIGSQGRTMQIVFEAPNELVSTEKFLIPYVLEGEVRAYNQKMLERSEIRSRALYYCVENETASWRYYDWRTLSTGVLTSEVLARLMEPLF
jgi:hypothetical protein